MSTHCYQTAYEHAASEIAEIDARAQRLIRRKELLEKLLDPLSLLASEPGATAAYQAACEQAAGEIDEIDAQIEGLLRRKELLERIIEPLKLLVSASEFSARNANASDNREFSDPGEFFDLEKEETTVVLVAVPEEEEDLLETLAVSAESEADGDFLESLAASAHPQAEETDINAGENSRSISHDDVAELAYRFWHERGQAHGYHDEDWLRAMQELENSFESSAL